MPSDFLTDHQKASYGRYFAEPSDTQLSRSFILDDLDQAIIKRKRRRNHNRLGFAVQLTTVRFLGTFLSNPIDVPNSVISYVAKQLNIKDPGCLDQYMSRKTTRYEHCEEIQETYDYVEFSDPCLGEKRQVVENIRIDCGPLLEFMQQRMTLVIVPYYRYENFDRLITSCLYSNLV